ncbi:hypothetical protein BGP68_24870 [Escherichia coli]|nr:DUF6404 family protein [Escherichia coli]ORR76926.1 hypothetical protein BGP69_25790 [Escherichia coli]ORR77258.1 hypothetical protein BGP68_24870 [Escherichia coli]ORR88728.1 hypothetical protein BGP67_24955 [Escherichia coli]OWH00111.1 hypothetical protein CCE12_21665 [Escherichia coli]OWH11049.1 hypothetical protein CCE10_17970 [Escherichia coli]
MLQLRLHSWLSRVAPRWFIYWGPSGMVAGEAIIISITGGFLFGLLTASFHWWRRKVNRLPPWDDV